MNKDELDDSFDCGYHLYAKEKHDARVAKTPERIAFAEERLKENQIEYVVKSKANGHFHAWGIDGLLHQFWASTGKILPNTNTRIKLGQNDRGIHNFIKFLKGRK